MLGDINKMNCYIEETVFEKEMPIVKQFIYEKGFLVESDHRFAYLMQYDEFFSAVSEWLHFNGYEGKLSNRGLFDGVAVYGIFDTDKIKFEEIEQILRKEAKKQR